MHLALASSLRESDKRPAAKAIDTIMSNQSSSALKKIPKFLQNFDVKPEPFDLDECTAVILHYDLSSHTYRSLTKVVNEKVKKLNWQLEKFRLFPRYEEVSAQKMIEINN